MKWTKEQQLENESKVAFRSLLLPTGWIIRDKNPDVGIDMEIEFVKGEEVENRLLWVQIKATESMESTNGTIPFRMETKHLKYYENAQLPVIILLWRKTENAFYYLFAQQYIHEKLSADDTEWRTKQTKTISFPGDSKLQDINSLRALSTEEYLYIIQQQLNIKPEAGSAIYWLDGIPRSDDEELKKRVLVAFSSLVKENYLKAISGFEEILRICTISPKQKMAVLLSLGNAYYSLGDIDQALKNFNAVIQLTPKVTEKDALIGKAFAIGNVGLIYATKGDLISALKYHEEALDLTSRIGDKKGQAIALSNIALNFRLRGDLPTALKWHEDALRIDIEIGSKSGEAASLCNIGVIYEERGEIDNALKYFAEGLRISQEVGFRKGEAIALGNIGLILASKGDTENALAYYERALKINREMGDRCAEADNLSNMGLIRGELHIDEALEDFEQSLFLERKSGHRRGEAIALGNIGLIYLNRGDLDRAFCNFIAALKIDKEVGYKEGEATDLSDIGMFYRAKGDLDNALKYFKEALTIDQKIGNRKGEVDDLYTIGLIYLDKGDSLNSLKNLVDASVIVDRFGIVVYREAIQSVIDRITNKYAQENTG